MAPFETTVKVRFHHMDRAGMIFHGAYTEFLQDAFEDLMDHIGHTEKDLEPELGIRVPVVQHEMAFPAHPDGDTLTVQVGITELGRSSAAFALTVLDDAGSVVAEATVVRVCIDERGKATPIPKPLREAWAGYQV